MSKKNPFVPRYDPAVKNFKPYDDSNTIGDQRDRRMANIKKYGAKPDPGGF